MLKMVLGMTQAIKGDLSKGRIKEWGVSVDGSMGYAITELGEKELYAALMEYQPYILFEVHAVLSADEFGNIVQAALKSLKK
ncbi:MAG: hypothetical protein ABSB40_10070 [Nitrososphaeria archaeon]|jgi:hypothetical protein